MGGGGENCSHISPLLSENDEKGEHKGEGKLRFHSTYFNSFLRILKELSPKPKALFIYNPPLPLWRPSCMDHGENSSSLHRLPRPQETPTITWHENWCKERDLKPNSNTNLKMIPCFVCQIILSSIDSKRNSHQNIQSPSLVKIDR